mmetsp:Transcript_88845/g.177668  ORF Transcript_88845/g.177668 Transcript_88845/m.177668 type:complete len:217 (-) Transcript_88845:187-837(-)
MGGIPTGVISRPACCHWPNSPSNQKQFRVRVVCLCVRACVLYAPGLLAVYRLLLVVPAAATRLHLSGPHSPHVTAVVVLELAGVVVAAAALGSIWDRTAAAAASPAAALVKRHVVLGVVVLVVGHLNHFIPENRQSNAEDRVNGEEEELERGEGLVRAVVVVVLHHVGHVGKDRAKNEAEVGRDEDEADEGPDAQRRLVLTEDHGAGDGESDVQQS